MFEIALKLVVLLALAALIGFVTAWLLRGLRMKALHAQLESQKTRMLEADRRAMLHQTELAGRDKRIGILDNELLEEKKRFAELFAEFQTTDQALVRERESLTLLRTQFVDGVEPDSAALAAQPAQVQALEQKIKQLEAALHECTQSKTQQEARPAARAPVLTPYAGNPPRQFNKRPPQVDDLKHIYGVGPSLEKLLQKRGIYLFKQVARWNDQDIDFFDARLDKFHGRIRREGWVRSAIEEHYKKYGEWLAEGEPVITKPETNR